MESLAAILRRIPFFADLPREELARVVGHLELREAPAGHVIFSQGDEGDGLYVIRSGAIEVVLQQDGTPLRPLAILGPDECFGEMSLLTGQKRSATVRALVDSALLKLPKDSWDDLIRQHPSINRYFCQVLSRRLGETNWEISKDRGALGRVLEDFFAGRPPEVQDLLVRTAHLHSLDPPVIASALAVPDPTPTLASLSAEHPSLVRAGADGRYVYLDALREFLAARQARAFREEERAVLHRRFAHTYAARGDWARAVAHWIRGGARAEAFELLRAHAERIQEGVAPEELLRWLDELQPHLPEASWELTRLRAGALVRLGQVDGAIRCYQALMAQEMGPSRDGQERAAICEELAALYQRQGRAAEALAILRQGLHAMGTAPGNTEALQALESVASLRGTRDAPEAAVRWVRRALRLAQAVAGRPTGDTPSRGTRWWVLLLGCAVGWAVWQIPPTPPLDRAGLYLLASLMAAVVVWAFNVFEDYVVALMLLLAWVLPGAVRPEEALAGFSSSAWFLFLGALGIGAAVTRSGLLYRVALQVLRRLPPSDPVYRLVLAGSGVLVTPIMPSIVGRLAIMAPVSQAIAEAMGYAPRSNGSAGLVLAAYVGFSQFAFMFLTGATGCLFGWNLLPETARATFAWGTWALAALPAGLVMGITLLATLHLLFPLGRRGRPGLSPEILDTQLEVLGPLSGREWTSLAVLGLALAGWVGKPLHGVAEAWVALAALLAFLMTGALDKAGLRSGIDWGFLLFFGVISSLGVMVPHLKVDQWLIHLIRPVLASVVSQPLAFLLLVLLLTYAVRTVLNKFPAILVLVLGLTPLAQDMGIHPGVLLLVILMGVECWFLPYQDMSYQITYYGTQEKAFSHAQGRALMIAKFLGSVLAAAVSVPYWRMLGLIR